MAVVTLASVRSSVEAFLDGPDVSESLALLQSRLPEGAVPYVVGGAIRNLVIRSAFGNAPNTQDIDIFIGGIPADHPMDDLLAGEVIEPTDLGGIRWHPADSAYAFDLCPLDRFFYFETYGLAPTIDHLLESIDFTVNAAVFDTVRKTLRENGCITAVERREIDFNAQRFPSRLLIAYRILLMRHKTDFFLAEPVFTFVKNQIDLDTLDDLKALLQSKVGKPQATAVMADYDRISAYRTYAAYRAAVP